MSWRTALRKLQAEKIEELPDDNKEMKYLGKVSNDLYLRLYLLEIINLIGIASVGEGYKILTDKIPEIFENIDKVYIYEEIVHDYCLYYGLNDGTEKKKEIDLEIAKLRDGKYLELIPYFKKNTNYDYLTSSFYSTEKGYLTMDILPYVCGGINKHMKSRGIEFSVLLAGDYEEQTYWTPFNRINFMEQGNANPICKFQPEYQESYSYDDWKWIKYSWINSKFKKAIIGYLIKITEKNLREYYHQNSRITVNLDKFLETKIYEWENFKDIYEKFREEIYSKESQDLIKKIVQAYIKKKVQ
ncbi:hypothetical protein SpiGrapes_0505 [Sphaerochaeta pleomorpha str. Grapes]|uniref:Uncharacterized protein n=1 Tax=Sphaerochaeta pleomorpha (strain ATCC BAA-1885 / DSM 22778 / Grapes) TaxID=158190 RepID=G8QWR5_SPHPG|nr:hypothetical protein [Sphaerochaeta pleomorpha]AEV28359.1 hypothetical protein SpiGrapes_0505 [Sphaerochaeta pleomorpha str. Grapes]